MLLRSNSLGIIAKISSTSFHIEPLPVISSGVLNALMGVVDSCFCSLLNRGDEYSGGLSPAFPSVFESIVFGVPVSTHSFAFSR